VNEVVAAEPSGRDIGKDREPALRELLRRAPPWPASRQRPNAGCVDRGANPEAVESAAAAEIEHVQGRSVISPSL
jgi:hypothetical protein